MPRHQTKRPEMMQLEMLAASFDAQVSVVGELWIPGLCPCQPALPTSGVLPRKAYSVISGELLNLLLWAAWVLECSKWRRNRLLQGSELTAETPSCAFLLGHWASCTEERAQQYEVQQKRAACKVKSALIFQSLCRRVIPTTWKYPSSAIFKLQLPISLHWETAQCMQSYISCIILHCSSPFFISFHCIYEI